jgi:ABC-type nitrate/sulfonate/bicarbonate transport system permease component
VSEPHTPEEQHVPDDGALTPDELDRIRDVAVPATLRRAPRYRAFFAIGAVIGIVAGIALGVWLSYDGMVNRWIYVTVIILATTLVTVLLAGLAVVSIDRRGARKR